MSLSFNITYNSNATTDISQHCEDGPVGVILWIYVSIFSFVLGFPGAIAILVDMCQKVRKGTPLTPNDVFMLNLTAMDGVYLFFLQPQLYNHLVWHNYAYETFVGFLYSFNLCGRPLFTICISLDCYLAVVHPVTYRGRKSLTPRVLMAVGVWIVTVTHGLSFASEHEENFTSLDSIFFYGLTLPVIGFCNFSILWTLKRSSPGRRDIHPQKKRALKIIINNLIVTFISYLPLVITQLLSQLASVDEDVIHCLILLPVMCITTAGNSVSVILHLNHLGKLDWLKC